MPVMPDDLRFADAEPRLHELAVRQAGHEDFGADEYREGLRVLLESLDADADLSPMGRQIVGGLLVTALTGRLYAEASMKSFPEHKGVSIAAPIVILGLPRTGTTALHKMLCCCPDFQGMELWLGHTPMPRPPSSTWPQEPAFVRCDEATRAMHAAAPDMASIHEMAADEPDECWNLLRQSFASVTFECVARVSSYSQWWSTCDMTAAYQRWADLLRLIGLNDTARRWVLKDPSHLFAPSALLEALPEALFVMTHRDPAKSIPSVCSLNATARAANDRVSDDIALGQEQLELWARGIERTLALRRQDPERFIDVAFRDFVTDPIVVAERIAERAGRPLASGAREAMEAWQGAHPSQPHAYEAARFGLAPESIRERFSTYLSECDVEVET